MPPVQATSSFSEALMRFGAMYGAAYSSEGRLIDEAVEVTAAAEINRIEVVMAGRTDTGYKFGRTGREGTLRVQKVDSFWEMRVFQHLALTDDERRAMRDRGEPLISTFNLILSYDDPYALGKERWLLENCLLWRLPLGFAVGDDVVDREYPLTWEREKPIWAFQRVTGPNGIPVPEWYPNYGPPPTA